MNNLINILEVTKLDFQSEFFNKPNNNDKKKEKINEKLVKNKTF